MKNIDNYIVEKLKINKNSVNYNYFPKDWDELHHLVDDLIDKRGKNANLNDIDVSKVEDFTGIFNGFDIRNIDISKWNVSNAKNMQQMFSWCDWLDCDLSGWDVSNVENMESMFYNCTSFKGKGLENWNVKKVEDMDYMFYNCKSLKNKPSWYKGKEEDD